MKQLSAALLLVLASVLPAFADVPALTPAQQAWYEFRTYLPYALMFSSFVILIVIAYFANKKRNGR